MTLKVRNIVNSTTVPETVLELPLPAGVTLVQAYPPKRYSNGQYMVEDDKLVMKLKLIPAGKTARIKLAFQASTSVSGTVSFPYTVLVPSRYCYQEGAASVRACVDLWGERGADARGRRGGAPHGGCRTLC